MSSGPTAALVAAAASASTPASAEARTFPLRASRSRLLVMMMLVFVFVVRMVLVRAVLVLMRRGGGGGGGRGRNSNSADFNRRRRRLLFHDSLFFLLQWHLLFRGRGEGRKRGKRRHYKLILSCLQQWRIIRRIAHNERGFSANLFLKLLKL